jgi:hypothetical protein
MSHAPWRKLLLAFAVLLLCAPFTFAQNSKNQNQSRPDDSTASSSVATPPSAGAGDEKEEGEQDDPSLRLLWERQAWGAASNELKQNTLKETAKHNKRLRKTGKGAESVAGTAGGSLAAGGNVDTATIAGSGGHWVPVGPIGADYEQNGAFTGHVRDSGRARTILPHPTNPDILYFLTSGGGLWKTTNFTSSQTNWTQLTDNLPTTGGGAVAFGRNPDTLYLGLGDPYDQVLVGGSVVKSTDGGASWGPMKELGTTVSVRAIGVDTSDPANDVVLVGTENGLYISNDSGNNFVPADPASFGGKAIWSIVRSSAGWLVSAQLCPAANIGLQCGQATTVYLSTDHGATWSAVPNTGGVLNGGRTTLAVGAPGDAVVYAYTSTLVEVTTSPATQALKDVYRSTDGGLNWVSTGTGTGKAPTNPVSGQTNMNVCHNQCWYNQMILVDPQDPTRNTVYIGGDLASAKTTNGGGSWTLQTWWLYSQFPALRYVHADMHAAAVSLAGTPTVIFGTDGGIFVSTDNSVSWSSDKNNGLQTHLFYTLTGNAKFPNLVLGGLQDNGTRLRDGQGGTFNQVIGGDGTGAAYSQGNTNTVFGSSQGSNMRTNLTNTQPNIYQNWSAATAGLSDFGFPFLTAMIPAPPALDPTGRVFYHFTQTRVWKTVNGGLNWTLIAAARPSTGVNQSPGLPQTRQFRSSPFNISVSPTDLNRIAVGAAGGFLDISSNGGASWFDLDMVSTVPGYQGFVSGVHWQDNKTLWVVSQAQASGSKRVLKGTVANEGDPWTSATWTTPDNGLPNLPVTRLLFDPRDNTNNTIYAATHVGIYRTTDGGANWAPFGTGLPNVRVNDIYMPPDGSFMRIATYGRGIWEMPQLEFTSASLTDDSNSCDQDGALDNGETGHLTITLRNQGSNPVDNISATITSSNPAVTFPLGNTVSFPTASAHSDTSATVQVTVNGAAAVDSTEFSIAFGSPDLNLATQTNVTQSFRVNYDFGTSATETAEGTAAGWSTGGSPTRAPNVNPWQVRALSDLQHVWWGPNNNGQNDGVSTIGPESQSLVSPVIHVGSDPFTITLTHRFSFEAPLFDGGTIEISTDDGGTWTDIGGSAYNGTLAAGTPLGSRPAFVNNSAGWPNFTTTVIDLGAAYADKDVRLRFQTASDNNTGAPGWDIDTIALAGVTNNPFSTLVAHNPVCADSASLVSSPNPSTFNQNVTFTATVSGGVTPATGTMQFQEGATTLGSATVSNGTASFSTSSLSVGTHNVFAVYSGDAGHAGNTTNTVAQVVTYGVCPQFDNSKATGGTIPVRVAVCDVNGQNIAGLTVTAVRLEKGGQTFPATSTGNANPGNVFKYDATNNYYQYNLSVKGLAAGTYQLIYTVNGDPNQHSVAVSWK